MRILTGRQLQINSIRFSPDGRYLACDGRTPIFRKWYVNVWQVHGAESPEHATEGEFNRGDGFTPNNRRLQFTQSDRRSNRRMALTLGTGGVVPDVPPLDTCEVSPDRRWTVYHEYDYLPHVHRLRAARNVGRKRVERWTREFPRTPPQAGDTFDGEEASFQRLEFAVNGSRILAVYRRADRHAIDEAIQMRRFRSSYEQELLRVLDTETGQDVAEWRGEPSKLTGPNGELLYSRGPSIRVLNALNFNQPAVTRTNSSGEDFTAAAFSPDGKLLATTSNDTTVTLWDTPTWQPIRQYGWEIGRLGAVAFAPDGLTCAAGSDTGKVVLFDVDG